MNSKSGPFTAKCEFLRGLKRKNRKKTDPEETTHRSSRVVGVSHSGPISAPPLHPSSFWWGSGGLIHETVCKEIGVSDFPSQSRGSELDGPTAAWTTAEFQLAPVDEKCIKLWSMTILPILRTPPASSKLVACPFRGKMLNRRNSRWFRQKYFPSGYFL